MTTHHPPQDAIALLGQEHEAISQLFAEYARARTRPSKISLVAEICSALRLHTQVEEEIFYPALINALRDDALCPQATIEHSRMRALMAQIDGVPPSGEAYDAKVKLLSDSLQHHALAERQSLFPKARASSLDLAELADRMAARKADLLTRET